LSVNFLSTFLQLCVKGVCVVVAPIFVTCCCCGGYDAQKGANPETVSISVYKALNKSGRLPRDRASLNTMNVRTRDSLWGCCRVCVGVSVGFVSEGVWVI